MNLLQVFTVFCFLKLMKSTHNFEAVEEKPTGRPLQVNASLTLININKVSEVEQTISLEISLKLFWRDNRLSFKSSVDAPKDSHHHNLSYKILRKDKIDKIWVPDLFVDQAVEVRNPAYKIPMESLRLYEDSSMKFSKRINFDAACRMDFRKFPVDTQKCIVRLESFSYTKEDLVVNWLGKDKISQNPNITLSHYNYKLNAVDEYLTHYYAESFSGLTIKIELNRKLRNHVMQDFIPSFLYVVIAYFAVLIPSKLPAVRTALILFPMLALSRLTTKVRSKIPITSVLTFLDIWLICCLAFIFSSMVIIISTGVLLMYRKEEVSRKLEFWFKVLFPSIFIWFLIVYWTALIYSS